MDFVVECFAPRSPEMKSLTDLARIQLAAQFQQTFATGQRSEDLRAETAGMDLVRNMRRLGPGRGIPAAHVISNKGKTNTVGKMTYTAMAPHMNPMFDSTAYSGLSYLLRFSVMDEPFPDHLDWKDFSRRPVYIEVHDKLCFLHYQVCSE
jgi:hypothetical protein